MAARHKAPWRLCCLTEGRCSGCVNDPFTDAINPQGQLFMKSRAHKYGVYLSVWQHYVSLLWLLLSADDASLSAPVTLPWLICEQGNIPRFSAKQLYLALLRATTGTQRTAGIFPAVISRCCLESAAVSYFTTAYVRSLCRV